MRAIEFMQSHNTIETSSFLMAGYQNQALGADLRDVAVLAGTWHC